MIVSRTYTYMCKQLYVRVYTWERFVMPRRKQMASRILLFPLPLRPVMALKRGSNPVTSVRWA